jgi:hypothetical protein
MKAWEIGLAVGGVLVTGVVGVMIWNNAQTQPPSSPVVPPPGTPDDVTPPASPTDNATPQTSMSGYGIGTLSRRRRLNRAW